MKEFLKSYTMTITTLSPTFIGSGKEYKSREYLYNVENDKVLIVNQQKLSELLCKKNLIQKFTYFVTSNNKNLYSWLINNQITKDEIADIVDYSFSANNLDMHKMYDIRTFIKDPYNKPYVPGSSVKGFIRTALLAYDIKKDMMNNQQKYSEAANEIQKLNADKNLKYALSKITTEIENKAFSIKVKDGNNVKYKSKMSGIIISDSKPISSDKLVLCRKDDVYDESNYHSLPIFFEALKLATKIECMLTIDSSKCEYSIGTIINALKYFAENYYDNYISQFSYENFEELDNAEKSSRIWIGGNTGFPTKTIIYNLFDKENGLAMAAKILGKLFPNKNKNDYQIGKSPHMLKRTTYLDEDMSMGECLVEFKAV